MKLCLTMHFKGHPVYGMVSDYRLGQHILLTTTGYGLMVGVLVLLHLLSSLSNSSIKALVVQVVLPSMGR